MSDHERNRVFALEGLDGVGKTTVGKLLAEQTGGQYLYFMDHNKMKPFRQRFDGAPTPIRFLYYLTATIDAYFQAEKLKQSSDVFVDRTVASLIAYHRAYSLSERWFWLIPHKLVSQIDTMIYFTMSEENRIARLQSRPLTIGDKSSLLLANKIEYEYHKLFSNNTVRVIVDQKNPEEIVTEIKGAIYG